MKELSKEERLNQRIEELEQLICEKDNAFDKEQGKRLKRTFYVLCGVFYLIELLYVLDGGISEISIDTICGLFFTPLFVAGCIMFVSYGVLFYILNGATTKIETIANLEGELNAIKSEKRNNSEDKKIKELERQIEHFKNYQEKLINENVCLRLNKVFDNDTEE